MAAASLAKVVGQEDLVPGLLHVSHSGAQAQGGSPEHKRPRLITQMLRPLFTAHPLARHCPKPELVGQRSILHTRFLRVVSTGLGASPGLCMSVVWSQCQ